MIHLRLVFLEETENDENRNYLKFERSLHNKHFLAVAKFLLVGVGIEYY